jgi:hypothetical protein
MNIRGSWYFPWPVRFAGGVILMLLAIARMLPSPLLASVLLILAAVILTTHYGVHIDLSKGTYKEYVWLLGWKNGKKISFKAIDYLFVKTNKVTRNYNSRVQRAAITNVEYDGYMRISESEKIHLINADTKQEVVKKLIPLKNYLKTRFIDYTRDTRDEI